MLYEFSCQRDTNTVAVPSRAPAHEKLQRALASGLVGAEAVGAVLCVAEADAREAALHEAPERPEQTREHRAE